MVSESSDSLNGDDLLSTNDIEKTTDNVEASEYAEENDTSTAQKSSDNENKNAKNRKEQQEDIGDTHEKEKNDVSEENKDEDMGEKNEKDEDWRGKKNGTEVGRNETRKEPNPFFSDRMEYISRPKKDFLDNIINTRLDGSLPENSYPSWKIISLPNKLPFDNCPIPVTKRKMGTNVSTCIAYLQN